MAALLSYLPPSSAPPRRPIINPGSTAGQLSRGVAKLGELLADEGEYQRALKNLVGLTATAADLHKRLVDGPVPDGLLAWFEVFETETEMFGEEYLVRVEGDYSAGSDAAPDPDDSACGPGSDALWEPYRVLLARCKPVYVDPGDADDLRIARWEADGPWFEVPVAAIPQDIIMGWVEEYWMRRIV
jgi:hypothetical protein